MNKEPEILVVGTGAVGAYFGGRLAQYAAKVSVVCRSDYDTVVEHGYDIESASGDFHFRPAAVYKSVGEYKGFPDYIFVALKVLPEIDRVEIIKPAVGPDTSIVLMQNGIEIEQEVADAFPENEIISGLAFIACSRSAPGKVHHHDYGHTTIGRYPEGPSKKAELLAEIFNRGPSKCTVVDDVQRHRWKKLVWNAPFNPVSVLCKADTSQIMNDPESRLLVEKIMEEICALAEAAGWKQDDDIIKWNIDATLNMIPYKTSMLQDFEAGRPLEIEAIIGNTVRAAKRLNMEIPRIETIYALLRLIAQTSAILEA